MEINAVKSWDNKSTILQDVRFVHSLEERFHGAKRWDMGNADQQCSWFADSQESRFQAANRSDIVEIVMKDFDLLILRKRVLRLGNFHIWVVPPCYEVELLVLRNAFSGFKSLNMGSAVLEVGRFADIHEFFFQAAKRSEMNCVELQGCLFADCQEWHFQVRNVQIITVPSARASICWSSRIVVSEGETMKYVQCSAEMRLICWYSWIVFWGLLMYTFGLFRPAMWSICRFSEVAFSGFETFKYG